ncbi:cytosol aminopeptidase family, catalytic domain protein [Dictyocaulus viviparus]|uniref:Cytosol aminopeptidase family, catalytic domain protein n=1 Tax=Dictyocaulus viviparus TaxID=29172 RepID=A0A0D8XE42_DICVI|nr:cytosol aminopeptidase family, catalytic domain protein [Dictyocaulus viviparus]
MNGSFQDGFLETPVLVAANVVGTKRNLLFGPTNRSPTLLLPFKTISKKSAPHTTLSRDLDKKFVQEIDNLATTVNQVRRLQDIPSDLIFPVSFVEEIEKICAKFPNIEKKALGRDQLKKLGMNLLLGVNKGSDKQPRLLILEYFGNPKSNEIYGLVGEGITFDSDDILVSYDGKTVQIDNTDAEGRLVLADAIAYARKHYKLSRIYDIATLTGAVEICFGDVYTGV